MARRKSRNTLQGKVVALTGGARGIGAATARELVIRGAQLTIGDLDLAAAEDTARKLAADLDTSVHAVQLDVSDPASYAAFLDASDDVHGPLDVLINNAGVDWIGSFHTKTFEVLRKEIDVNLMGTVIGTKLALERMLPRDAGFIVNVASANGRVPGPGSSAYTATKYGVVGLTESLRLEYRHSGVEFSLIHPGQIKTDMLTGTGNSSKLLPVIAPEQVARGIADAIENRQFEVWVPANQRFGVRLGNVIPRALYERALLSLGVDAIALNVDHDERADYHDRMFGTQT